MFCAVSAVAVHLSFCEWRKVEYGAEDAYLYAPRVLYGVKRVEHDAGNAAAWHARRLELQLYHAVWIDCWQAEVSEDEMCSAALLDGNNPTSRAMSLALCDSSFGRAAPSRSHDFHECVREQGYETVRAPIWTRDDFGKRFDGPYVTQTALFA